MKRINKNKKETTSKVENMSLEEKLKKLSETDRAYIQGYIDRAYIALSKEPEKNREKGASN